MKEHERDAWERERERRREKAPTFTTTPIPLALLSTSSAAFHGMFARLNHAAATGFPDPRLSHPLHWPSNPHLTGLSSDWPPRSSTKTLSTMNVFCPE